MFGALAAAAAASGGGGGGAGKVQVKPQVACGGDHTVALESDGSLWAWGYNTYGQLGLGGITANKLSPIRVGTACDWVAVACGAWNTEALKSDGSLWSWGDNTDGQLGVGGNGPRYSPTRVGTDNDWVAVVCGSFSTLALKSDGSLWAWGENGSASSAWATRPTALDPDRRLGTDSDWMAVACSG